MTTHLEDFFELGEAEHVVLRHHIAVLLEGSGWGVSSRGGSHREPLGAIGSRKQRVLQGDGSLWEPLGATGSHWESFEARE